MKKRTASKLIAILMAMTMLMPMLAYSEALDEPNELVAETIDSAVPEVENFLLPDYTDDFQSEANETVYVEAQVAEEDVTENTEISESIPEAAAEILAPAAEAPVTTEETSVIMTEDVQINAKLAEAASGVSVTTVKNKSVLNLTKGDVVQLAVNGRTIKSCKSSKRKVAGVSKAGVLTAKKQGKTKVTVNLKGKGRKKITVTVKVTDPTLPTKVSITNGKTVTVGKGQSVQLNTVLTPNTAWSGLKWKSSKRKIATVNGNGVVTAKKLGKTKITVTTRNGKKASVTVKVVKAAATSTSAPVETPTTAPHVHNFQPVSEKVWVVDKPYWVEGTWEYRHFVACNGCGRLFNNFDEYCAHRDIVLCMRDKFDSDDADYVLQQLNYAINEHEYYNAPDTNNVDPLIQQMINTLKKTGNVADIREMAKKVIAQETAGGPTEDPVSGRTWINRLDGSKCEANTSLDLPFKLDYFVENPTWPLVNKPHVAEGHYETKTVYKCSCGAVK